MTYYTNPATGYTMDEKEWLGTSGLCGYRLETEHEAAESESEKVFFKWEME